MGLDNVVDLVHGCYQQLCEEILVCMVMSISCAQEDHVRWNRFLGMGSLRRHIGDNNVEDST